MFPDEKQTLSIVAIHCFEFENKDGGSEQTILI